MIVLAKLMIVTAVVGLLRSSSQFRSMSRELDQQAFSALKKIMNAAEECGYPPHLVPLLLLLTALSFMLSLYFTMAVGR